MLDQFYSQGYVHLKQVVPRIVVERMVDQVWQLMNQQGLERDDPTTWRKVVPYVDIRGVSKLQQLRSDDASPEAVPEVKQVLNQLFGDTTRTVTKHWGQVLATLPCEATDWLMPCNIWHFDHAYKQSGDISGVNVFLLMDGVESGGGGTVVVRNSPLLMDKYLATHTVKNIKALNRDFLQFDPWLSGLKTSPDERSLARNQAYMQQDTLVQGVPTRIVELTGDAGDVFITHPALMHAPAMNVRDKARLMRTQRVYAQG